MTQTHHLPVPLQQGSGTQALWALNPVGHAVIFVHGFAGKAITTWTDFPTLLPQQTEAAGCDLIFYGYDGKHARATVSAADLRNFIHALYTAPLDAINRTLPETERRADSFKYTAFTVIAHSLGAIVARAALLDGYRSRMAWAPLTRLILFAPAHMGANMLVLIRETFFLWPVIWAVSALGLIGRYTVLQDLNPNCQMLTYLLDETRRLLAASSAPTLTATRVLLAENDTVVHPIPFAADPPPDVIKGTRHINVCKPRPGFLKPLQEVRKVL